MTWPNTIEFEFTYVKQNLEYFIKEQLDFCVAMSGEQ